MKGVEIIVKPDGSVTFDAKGFTGAECEKVTKALEESLGETITNKRKPEFHRREAQKARQTR